ncbi:protein ENDOSPERM DEFECTIVE 1 [Oryza sativa Japonica Group]|uniref:Streptococcal hemagglutinin-like protein n=1 Tax=Oryza sativa subsp. japonica TaxID=39947 RepID=Q6EN70_ORYSJ|nr:protein ENDOSPERM DEFECTIVE 1 [Oryza sativa Japonica Group]KAF2915472.1 hypothetical protein DAI22_09g036600 [Oryza sativa Japonica Group]BAD29665.1 streptococcal hemagglutinin-like protein [Oryza sativa Japonica Group]
MAIAAPPPPPPPPQRTDMPAAADLPPPPPPLAIPLPETTRRPRRRTREVSSRYLSSTTPGPVPSSPRLSTSSSRTPSPRAHRPRAATPFANENHPPPPPPPSTASRRRAVLKLFDDGSGGANPRASAAAAAGTPRALHRSTSGPAAAAASTARRGYPRMPTPARAASCPSSSSAAAADDAASCCSSDTGSTFTDLSEVDGIALPAAPCESPPLLGPASCRGGRLSSELRSSVPESGGSVRALNPLCYRSLNSALSGCPAPAGKAAVNAARPPQPHGVKAAESKKVAMIGGRKVPGKQEDVHQLRMLENSYLQYRFMNARAEAVARAKASVAEKSLFGLEERITALRVSVAEKKMEVERMRREQTLRSVVDAQVPHLDQWCDLEGDHSSSLIGLTSALYNSSLRLPVIGNVRANSEEITEVLNSSVQLLEPVSSCVKNFLPKVQEVDDVAAKLAQVIASERVAIEECGNLLYQAHNLQMREYSLRSQVMQLKQQDEPK